MGSYTFKWEHPAEEVYVTGTFDNWTKSVKLEKNNGIFEKKVDLKDASDKIYYKFVVDNNWTLNESSPKEADKEGNVNNFLTPNDIALAGVLPAITNVGPGSSTANMAGAQPLEKDLNKSVGINPLPASGDAKNPIQLKPGEKVPQDLAASDINQNVKLDKDSYEQSDALTGGANTAAISNVGPGATTAALAGQVPLEPKSGATKTPDATSGDDDKKKKKKNKKKNKKKKNANGGAATADNKDDEDDKDDGEAEEEKPAGAGTVAAIAGGATAAGGAAVAAAVAASQSASDKAAPVLEKAAPQVDSAKAAAAKAANDNIPDSVKEKLPNAAQEVLAGGGEKPASEVPAEVKESQKEAGVSPEASANVTAVEEKKAVETELLKEVKQEDSGEEAKRQADAAAATPAAAVPAAAETGGVALPLTDKTSEAKPTETTGAAVSDAKDATTSASALPLTSDEPAASQGSSSSAAAPVAAAVGGTAAIGGAAAIAASKAKESEPAPAIATDSAATATTTTTAPSSTAAAIESKPVESTPPAASASESKPVEAKPITTKPAESTPAAAHPVASKPAETAPVVASPAEAQTTKAAESKPVAGTLAASKPVEAAKSAAADPTGAAKATAAKAESKVDAAKSKVESAANGSGSKPAESSSKPADSSAAAGESRPDTAVSELKKKSRLSSIFSKIKSKLSDKH